MPATLMEPSSDAAVRVQQLEAQQDAILRQLEELEQRTEAVLAQHAAPPVPAAGVDATSDLAAAPTSTPEEV